MLTKTVSIALELSLHTLLFIQFKQLPMAFEREREPFCYTIAINHPTFLYTIFSISSYPFSMHIIPKKPEHKITISFIMTTIHGVHRKVNDTKKKIIKKIQIYNFADNFVLLLLSHLPCSTYRKYRFDQKSFDK